MKDKNYLINAYNGTSTDDGKGDIETYEAWLERQLLSRIDKVEELQAEVEKKKEIISTQNRDLNQMVKTIARLGAEAKELEAEVERLKGDKLKLTLMHAEEQEKVERLQRDQWKARGKPQATNSTLKI